MKDEEHRGESRTGMELTKHKKRLRANRLKIPPTDGFAEIKGKQRKVFSERKKKHKEFLEERKSEEYQVRLED